MQYQYLKEAQKKLQKNLFAQLHIQRTYLIPQASFFIHYDELLPLELGRVSILSMSHFQETETKEQQMYEKRIQAPVANKVYDLRHEIKFQNCMKNQTNFFIKQNYIYIYIYIWLLYGKWLLYYAPCLAC